MAVVVVAVIVVTVVVVTVATVVLVVVMVLAVVQSNDRLLRIITPFSAILNVSPSVKSKVTTLEHVGPLKLSWSCTVSSLQRKHTPSVM